METGSATKINDTALYSEFDNSRALGYSGDDNFGYYGYTAIADGALDDSKFNYDIFTNDSTYATADDYYVYEVVNDDVH